MLISNIPGPRYRTSERSSRADSSLRASLRDRAAIDSTNGASPWARLLDRVSRKFLPLRFPGSGRSLVGAILAIMSSTGQIRCVSSPRRSFFARRLSQRFSSRMFFLRAFVRS